MHAVPEAKVVAWLNSQPRSSIWTTSITILEIRFGLQIVASGKSRSALLKGFESLLESIEHRIAHFDHGAANESADLMAARQSRGQRGDMRDIMIAGIVLARHASLATRNVAHFRDLPATVVNPWTA
jgi:predicted nucleic acid-binding protein